MRSSSRARRHPTAWIVVLRSARSTRARNARQVRPSRSNGPATGWKTPPRPESGLDHDVSSAPPDLSASTRCGSARRQSAASRSGEIGDGFCGTDPVVSSGKSDLSGKVSEQPSRVNATSPAAATQAHLAKEPRPGRLPPSPGFLDRMILSRRVSGPAESAKGRGDFTLNELTSGDFTQALDPVALVRQWFEEAKGSEPHDPEAMALATVDQQGLPNVRMVLMKDFDENGLIFYTNEESAKGLELAAAPKAAALFHWK